MKRLDVEDFKLNKEINFKFLYRKKNLISEYLQYSKMIKDMIKNIIFISPNY